MDRFSARTALIAFFLVLTVPVAGDEVLSNADIVKLVEAGLSIETIVAKIDLTPSRFDVSTDALVALAKAGVPDAVVRAMVVKSPAPAASPGTTATARNAPEAPRKRTAPARRYDVAVHRSEHVKCDGAELRVDRRGVKSSRCRGIDFDLTWSAVQRACYDYGFRGTIVFFTATGEHRISTTTPAAAKAIVDQVRNMAPGVAVAACRGD